MYTVYILFSELLDRYYTGFTSGDLEQRLKKHNTNHKGFTGKSKDWNVVYYESYESLHEAHNREKQIKKWKSRKQIERLIKTD